MGIFETDGKFKEWKGYSRSLKNKKLSNLNTHWFNERIITMENECNVLEVQWGGNLKIKEKYTNRIHMERGKILGRCIQEI